MVNRFAKRLLPISLYAPINFRYFAGVIRAQQGGISEIDDDTVAYHFNVLLGIVGPIIPWNFPLLMAAWKLASALAAGNCVVHKPAEQTPTSILILLEFIGDLLPPGVLNVVNGFGREVWQRASFQPMHQQSRVHRLDGYGSPHHAICVGERYPNDSGTRQISEHLRELRLKRDTTDNCGRANWTICFISKVDKASYASRDFE